MLVVFLSMFLGLENLQQPAKGVQGKNGDRPRFSENRGLSSFPLLASVEKLSDPFSSEQACDRK